LDWEICNFALPKAGNFEFLRRDFSNGEQWKALRKASQQQLLKPQHVAQFLPQVERISQFLIEEIRAQRDKVGAVPSLYGLIARWYLESKKTLLFLSKYDCKNYGAEIFLTLKKCLCLSWVAIFKLLLPILIFFTISNPTLIPQSLELSCSRSHWVH
jgi:hypothetical protein